MSSVVIVDYGLGNLGSLHNMCKRMGFDAVVTDRLANIAEASHLILPGVGSFDAGMKQLRDKNLVSVLAEAVIERNIPILGICLGAQLMLENSEEGTLPGLGWIQGRVKRFPVQEGLKIPHMGWNSVVVRKGVTLYSGMPEDLPRFYFVHAYYLEPIHDSEVTAECIYGHRFAASFQKCNIQGVQFHPEKSHQFGMRLLQNFLSTS